jgi:nucleotide-binding universal stress UspA family protein
MSFETIVVGYDETPEAQRALEAAADLAERLSARLVVTSVAAVMTGVARQGGTDPTDPPERHEEELAHARDYLSGRKVEADFVPGVGDPADALIELAKERNADLIAVGPHHHRHLFERLTGSSVSQSVAHRAPCSVLIVN